MVHRRETDANGAGKLYTEIGVGFEAGAMPLRSSFHSVVTLDPLHRVHAVSEPNKYIEHLSFTWDFAPLGERSCRLDLQLEFALRSPEHALIWEFAQDKVVSEYVRCFSKRCIDLEAAATRVGED